MASFEKTDNTTITRLAKRGAYDQETIYGILDEAMFCTVAFVRDGQPVQIPTGFARIGDRIYIHGSVGSSYMRALATGDITVCLSATVLDGLVLARAAFHHSVNYRSVVLFGKPAVVTDVQEQSRALESFTEKMVPGRWHDVRKPSAGEWKATMVLSIPIVEVSAKVRQGGPVDDDEDYALDVWAGVVPLVSSRQAPVPDPRLKEGVPVPPYLIGHPDPKRPARPVK